MSIMTTTAKSNTVITKIEPLNWFAGMNNPKLQLMVYGPGIRDAEASTDYPGVSIDSIVKPDSPNYLFLYLDLKGAQPGTMRLNFTLGKKKIKYDYLLRQRMSDGKAHKGFDNSDVLYMLMPDRFAQGSKGALNPKMRHPYTTNRAAHSLRHGGNLAGIREHLDYFCDLGVTALWLTPVLENDMPDDQGQWSCYHGYATTDYYQVDPRFGTNEEYAQLIEEAHKKGLKVVMDMIFNHCGLYHPWVSDMPTHDWFNEPECIKAKNGKIEIDKDKYLQTSYMLTPIMDPYASQVDKRETVQGWFVPTMPDLNQHNPHLMRYLIQNSEWWVETTGIDGIRMDTYPYAYNDAMAEWMLTLKDEYPNFNVVGETWVIEPPYTAAWQTGSKNAKNDSHLPTVMDFSFYDKLSLAKTEESTDFGKGMNRIYNNFVYDYLYADPSHVMAFIENHDTDRFLGKGRDTLALRQALALLLTANRIPQLYYGTEVLMNGTKEESDGYVRKDFPGGFNGDTHNAFTKEGRTAAENSMYNWLRRVLQWRKGNDVITKGKMTQFIPHDGVYVFARQLNGKTALTIINGTTAAKTMPVKRYSEVIGNTVTAKDITTGRNINISQDISLKPRQTMILWF